MRRLLALALICLTGFGLASCQAEAEASHEQPNILLIIADDIGYSDLGSYGSEIQTPVLDELAAQDARHLIDAVCKKEATVKNRYGCFVLGQVAAVHIDGAGHALVLSDALAG